MVGAGVAIFKPDSSPNFELRIRDEDGNDPLNGVFIPPGRIPLSLSCPHATATTPAEPAGAHVARVPTAGSHRAFLRRVGFRITRFEACSAFTCCGLRTR